MTLHASNETGLRQLVTIRMYRLIVEKEGGGETKHNDGPKSFVKTYCRQLPPPSVFDSSDCWILPFKILIVVQ